MQAVAILIAAVAAGADSRQQSEFSPRENAPAATNRNGNDSPWAGAPTANYNHNSQSGVAPVAASLMPRRDNGVRRAGYDDTLQPAGISAGQTPYPNEYRGNTAPRSGSTARRGSFAESLNNVAPENTTSTTPEFSDVIPPLDDGYPAFDPIDDLPDNAPAYNPPTSAVSNPRPLGGDQRPNKTLRDDMTPAPREYRNQGNAGRTVPANIGATPLRDRPVPTRRQTLSPRVANNEPAGAPHVTTKPTPSGSIPSTPLASTGGTVAETAGSSVDASGQSIVPGDTDLRKRQGAGFMTILALFASVGLNFYLGWIAWDTYNRYQDLVADMRYSNNTRRDRTDPDERELDRKGSGRRRLVDTAAY